MAILKARSDPIKEIAAIGTIGTSDWRRKDSSWDGGVDGTYPQVGFRRSVDGVFLRIANGEIVNLGSASPVAINDRGEIAESCSPDAACLREPDELVYRFSIPNSTTTGPNVMNERGEITGTYSDGSGTAHAFLLTSKRFLGEGFRF